jgi:hypothetical protein
MRTKGITANWVGRRTWHARKGLRVLLARWFGWNRESGGQPDDIIKVLVGSEEF